MEYEERMDFEIYPGYETPDWAKGAVMYQIYIDRFYNGDKSNDVETGEYFYIGDVSTKVDNWEKTPAVMGVREFYGGDLQGILDKLDYLQDLGVEVLYLNPTLFLRVIINMTVRIMIILTLIMEKSWRTVMVF